MEPNFEFLETQLVKYPGLDYILLGGVVSNKLVRTVLRIDRWEMEELHAKLLKNGLIKGLSSSTFRGLDYTVEYIRERIAEYERE